MEFSEMVGKSIISMDVTKLHGVSFLTEDFDIHRFAWGTPPGQVRYTMARASSTPSLTHRVAFDQLYAIRTLPKTITRAIVDSLGPWTLFHLSFDDGGPRLQHITMKTSPSAGLADMRETCNPQTAEDFFVHTPNFFNEEKQK